MTQSIVGKSLYESDFWLWTQDTIAKLKARDFDHLDLENLLEEIEALGRSEKKRIGQQTRNLIMSSSKANLC